VEDTLQEHSIEQLTTERLVLQPLMPTDAPFMHQLTNTTQWLRFIGNRNIASTADAELYIEKIRNNKNALYWTVQRAEDQQMMGIVTFMKRAHLDYPDIGFAFLPVFFGQGYAYEATNIVLKAMLSDGRNSKIIAISKPDNSHSIKLLEKLGMVFDAQIQDNDEWLSVYEITRQ
jgi:[ribosomal protein S5]-alanine N-acetyltransferase